MAADPPKMRRELLLAAIPDIQGSIHANDAKSSAGLVVHGLLFAGVLAVTSNLKGVYTRADHDARVLGAVALGLAGACFAISILRMIAAVMPYSPSIADQLGESAFFPLPDELAGVHWPRTWLRPRLRWQGTGDAQVEKERQRLQALASAANIEGEYAAEVVKLAELREVLATRTKRSFQWLRLSLAFVAVYLGLVAMVATGVAGVHHKQKPGPTTLVARPVVERPVRCRQLARDVRALHLRPAARGGGSQVRIVMRCRVV